MIQKEWTSWVHSNVHYILDCVQYSTYFRENQGEMVDFIGVLLVFIAFFYKQNPHSYIVLFEIDLWRLFFLLILILSYFSRDFP